VTAILVGAEEYLLYTTLGSFGAQALCNGQAVANGIGTFTAPSAGTVTLVAARAANRGLVTYEQLTLTPAQVGGPIDGGPISGTPPGNAIRHEITWTIPMNPQTLSVNVNDEGVFTWVGTHNVYQSATKADFDACSRVGGTMLATSAVNTHSITFTQAGTYYYICEIAGHCDAGQKLAVTVGGPGNGTPNNANNGNEACSGGLSPVAAGFVGVLVGTVMFFIGLFLMKKVFVSGSSSSKPAAAWKPSAPPQMELQSGWTAQKDPASGQTYYYNSVTGQTSWTPPDKV